MTEVNPILEASKRLINSANAGEDISDILKYLSRENLEDILVHVKSHRVIFADLFKSTKNADRIVRDIIVKIQEAIKVSEPSPLKPVRQSVVKIVPQLQKGGLPKSFLSKLSPTKIVDLLAEKLTTRNEKDIRLLLAKLGQEKLEDVANDATDRSNESSEIRSIMTIARAVSASKKSSKSSQNISPAFTNNILD